MGIKVIDQVDSVIVQETGSGLGSHIDVLQVPIKVGGPVQGHQPMRWEIELSHYTVAAIIRAARDLPVITEEIARQDAGG